MTNGRKDGWKNRKIDDGWIDGWMERWRDGWMMEGSMKGWMDR